MSGFISGNGYGLTTTTKPPKHAYAMWGMVGLSYSRMSERVACDGSGKAHWVKQHDMDSVKKINELKCGS